MAQSKQIREEYRSAEERFREALEEFPRSPGLLARLGKCLATIARAFL